VFSIEAVDNDALLLKKFYNFKTSEEKVNWLYKSENIDINAFVIKNKSQFDSLTLNVRRGDNEYTKYQLNFIEGLFSAHQNK
jgi:hypothetical protein